MGRIGRAYLRFAETTEDIEVVAVNDAADATTIARLLRRDSTFGPFGTDVIVSVDYLLIGGRRWPSPQGSNRRTCLGVSTGRRRYRVNGQVPHPEGRCGHLAAGAARVLISAPGRASTPPS